MESFILHADDFFFHGNDKSVNGAGKDDLIALPGKEEKGHIAENGK